MTDVKVVDASALAAILFAEPEAATIAAHLRGARLAAPALLWCELANVALNKCKRHPDQRDQILQAFELRHRLQIEEIAVDHSAILKLALQTGLTAYDASYLWLARNLNCDLVTLDKRLSRAFAPG